MLTYVEIMKRHITKQKVIELITPNFLVLFEIIYATK